MILIWKRKYDDISVEIELTRCLKTKQVRTQLSRARVVAGCGAVRGEEESAVVYSLYSRAVQ